MAFVHLLTCWYLLSGVFSRDLPVVPVGRECKEEICSIEYKGPGLYTFSKVYPHLERVEIDRFAKSRLDISNTPNLNRVSIVWSSGLPSISCQVLQNVDHCLTLEIEDREIRCCSSTTHEAESTKAPTTEAPNTEVSTAKTPTPEALNTEVSTAKTPTPEASRQTPSTGDASYDTDPTTEGDTSTDSYIIYIAIVTSILIILLILFILIKLRQRCGTRHTQHDIEAPIELPRYDYSSGSEETVFDQSTYRRAKHD